ncbi:MAG TPA: segregation/condensation protein A [bacterium]|nr:segregation/condensation protein A [bacterium]
MYDPLQVTLPIFDGPLDLLLHLVRKQELDINEVRLADLTEPYLAYVERIQELNLDQGGEFLAIAATLIWIKSRTLLPRETQEEDEPDPETLEEMLLLRLQEYQRFKDAAVQLADRDLLGRDVFARSPESEPEAPPSEGPAIEEVSLFSLLEAFREALERSANVRNLHIIPERSRVEDKVDALLRRMASGSSLFLHDLFADAVDREEIILTFIAMLELVRLQAVRISQAGLNGPVLCTATERLVAGGEEFRARLLAGILGESAEPPDDPPAAG